MLVQSPTCHVNLVRENPERPWAVDLTAGFVPADGIVHYESFAAASRAELAHLLSALGVNGIQVSLRETTGGEAHSRIVRSSPDEIAARLSDPALREMSLVVLGCTGHEMARKLAELRPVSV
jgi:hypothetical protein